MKPRFYRRKKGKPRRSPDIVSVAAANGLEFPEECSTSEERIEWIIKLARDLERTNAVQITTIDVQSGRHLIVLKVLTKAHKEKWLKSLKKIGCEPRTAQRRMKLARHLDLERFPVLAHLGQDRLINAIRLLKKGERLSDFLQQKAVPLGTNPKKKKEVRDVKKKLDSLIRKASTKETEEQEDNAISDPLGEIKSVVRRILRDSKELSKLVGFKIKSDDPIDEAPREDIDKLRDLLAEAREKMEKISKTLRRFVSRTPQIRAVVGKGSK